jgi:hypothetical protein
VKAGRGILSFANTRLPVIPVGCPDDINDRASGRTGLRLSLSSRRRLSFVGTGRASVPTGAGSPGEQDDHGRIARSVTSIAAWPPRIEQARLLLGRILRRLDCAGSSGRSLGEAQVPVDAIAPRLLGALSA